VKINLLALLAVMAGGSRIGAQLAVASPETVVFSARAYDRANQLDSARLAYAAAAEQLPSIGDWLRLRAAGVTSDSATRVAYYVAMTSAIARDRIRWTEAQARERTGDLAGAARIYAAIGARPDALRDSVLAVASSTDTAARAALRPMLLALVAGRPGTADARAATEMIDRLFSPLGPAEELMVARSAGLSGPASRAAAAFDRVTASVGFDSLDAQDLYLYGMALERVRRDADAAQTFGALLARSPRSVPPALAHGAMYQQGRALVAAGDRAAARRVLRALTRVAPRDTAAASALMLLADLATDDRDDAGARRGFLDVSRRFPQGPLAPRARFRAALLAMIGGTPSQAAREWDALVAQYPRAEDATAARYWSGRAWARAGNTRRARDRWRSVIAGDPMSYYASLSARRLGAVSPSAPVAVDTEAFALPPAIDSAIQRTAQLESLGLAAEARFEVDYALRAAGDTASVLITTATALVRAGEPTRAVALGWRLIGRSDSAWRNPRILRLVYPLAYGDTLTRDAHAKGLDPALVAAIVRQESAFNPRAVSVAGARGLMQLMPSVGHGLASARRLGPWDVELLDQPDINLALGVSHLATFLAQESGDVVRTLAAYNAGPSRVALWRSKRGVDDPEVFVERIPFAETRDYVRAILRGREMYAALYGLR
jgi:soluble lytic murein transglycosylase